MTAPVRTVAVKFTAQGSEAVRAAMEQVSTSATRAAERAAAAAAKSAARVAEAQQAAAQQMLRSRQAAERAAYAEEAFRERMAQRAIATAQQVALASANRAASAVESSAGRTARSVAISLDQIASTGHATSAVLRKVATDAAQLTLMFQPGGHILAAVGIAGLAVFNFFANAREERKKLEEEAIEGMQRLRNAGDVEGMKQRLMDIERGTPGEDRKDSLAAQQRVLTNLKSLQNPFSVVQPAERATWFVTIRRQIAEQEEKVKSLRAEWERLSSAIVNFDAPNTLPTTRPNTITAPAGRRFADADIRSFQTGVAGNRPLGDFSQRLDPFAAATLAPFTAIQPFGDPKKFVEQLEKDLRDEFKNFKLPPLPEPVQWRQDFAAQVSNALVDGFSFGIERAIASGSIGEGFKALTGTLLSGLGGAMIDFGKSSLMASTLMERIFKSLSDFLPGGAVSASLAMIAGGSILRGVASSTFGSMGGRGGGGGGRSLGSVGAAAGAMSASTTRLVFGQNSLSTAAGMTPRSVNQIIVIGEDDPRAQRALSNILANAEGRGLRPSRRG